MKVVVVAGGKGTRLGLEGIPKPMVPILGKPLLHRLVDNARESGFVDLLFLTGHLSEVIEEYFGDGSAFGVKIEYSRESQPLGTAGCFLGVAHKLTDPFLVLYADILMDVDLRHFANFALQRGGVGALFVHPNDHPFDSDLLEIDESQRISRFHPKPHSPDKRLPNLVSAALYVLHPSILQYIKPNCAQDWGKDVFPNVLSKEVLYAYKSLEYAKDMGTKSRLAKGEDHILRGRVSSLSRRVPKPAVFVDRDGVLNEEIGGVSDAEELKLLPRAAKSIRRLNDAGLPVICVTNQPGLAKGFFDQSGLATIHAELDCLIAAESGGYLDDMYVCPHHPEGGWPGEVPQLKINCDCRKPKPGLLSRATEAHNLDLPQSWMIGDRYCDIAAGRFAGVRTILVRTGHNGNDRSEFPGTQPDYHVDDIDAAVSIVLNGIK